MIADSMISYALKEANVNSTSVYNSKKVSLLI